MSEINSKNFVGANVVVVGVAGSAPEVTSFKNGGNQTSLSIAVSTGYKKDDEWVDTGTNWYTLTAKKEYADANWPDVQAGDKVRVEDARLELKAYAKKDGTPAVEARLKFGSLVVVEAKADRPASKRSVETLW